MSEPRTITEPNNFRVGVNPAGSGADIPPRRFVMQGTNPDEIALADDPNEVIKGVSVETIYEGKSQSYQVAGKALIDSGAAVAAGAYLTSDATGRAVTATAGDLIKGRAETIAGDEDEVIEIEIFPGVAFVPAA